MLRHLLMTLTLRVAIGVPPFTLYTICGVEAKKFQEISWLIQEQFFIQSEQIATFR